MKFAVMLLISALWGATSLRADSVSLSPVLDNTLIADTAGAVSNGSGPVFFSGNNSSSLTLRGVIAFDIAATIPQEATIDSVVLKLQVSSTSDVLPRLFTLHRVLAAWGEGASSAGGGRGALSEPGDATWLHTFYPSMFWSTPGGDFDAAVSGSTMVDNVGFYSWSSAAMAADVQQWLDTPASDFGWLVRGDEGIPTTSRRFGSRQDPTVQNRPVLEIWYTPPETPAAPTTWGQLKERFRR